MSTGFIATAEELAAMVDGTNPKPHSVIVSVDKATAERWLAKNPNNRKLRMATVAKYAGDMMAGKWTLGESIMFSADGTLINGQHRLSAVVMADVTVQMFVTRNLPPDVMDNLDSGIARSAADALHLRGHGNSVVSAASAKWCLLFDSNQLYGDRRIRQTISHAQIIEYVVDNDELADSVLFTAPIQRSIDLTPSILVTSFYLCMRVDQSGALEFFNRLADGIGLPKGSPVLALRSRLRQIKNDRTRIEPEAYLSCVLRAWNAWRAGKSMATIPVFRGQSSIHCPQPR